MSSRFFPAKNQVLQGNWYTSLVRQSEAWFFGGKTLLNSCLNLILEKTDFSTSYISIGPAGLIYFQRKSNFFSHQNKYSLASSKCYS